MSAEAKARQNWNKGLTKETDERVAKGAETLREGYKSGRIKHGRYTHTEETKKYLSKIRSEWLSIPENRKNYGRHKKSWMEEKFEEWLNNSNIFKWESEKHFRNIELGKNYYCDFVFEDIKLIIELDGTQHLKSKEDDAIRDLYLNSVGYKVVRIDIYEFRRYFSGLGFEDIIRG